MFHLYHANTRYLVTLEHLLYKQGISKPVCEVFCLWFDVFLAGDTACSWREGDRADQKACNRMWAGNWFCISPFCSASQQQITHVSSPSACMCVRRNMPCAGAPSCWRAPCLPTCPASASLPASPSPTPGYAPTPSLDEKSKTSLHAVLDKLLSCLAQWEDCGIFYFYWL